jgi:hypothetical protein
VSSVLGLRPKNIKQKTSPPARAGGSAKISPNDIEQITAFLQEVAKQITLTITDEFCGEEENGCPIAQAAPLIVAL